MVDELPNLIVSFPGNANRTCCFNHVLSLVARSIIRQFDVPKAQADEALSEAEKELAELADGLDLEEELMGVDEDVEDEEDDNDLDAWVDEQTEMSKADRKTLDASVQPVRLVLVEVSRDLC